VLKKQKNDLNPTYLVKRNFCFETEGVLHNFLQFCFRVGIRGKCGSNGGTLKMPLQQNKVGFLFLAFFILVDRLIGTHDDNNVAHCAFASSKMVFKGRRGGSARDSLESMQKGL
jgi:hypothetical protein